MLALYIVTSIVAGALIVLSAVLGHSESGGDHDVSHDTDHGADHDTDLGHGTWLPFLSVRFWTYALATFGLIGLLFTIFDLANAMTTLITAVGVGLGMGFAVSALIRLIRNVTAGDGTSDAELLGMPAKLLVPIKENQPGKIRTTIRGELIDMLAFSDGGNPIDSGEEVIILAIESDRARVAKREDVLG
ncbi:MAG TPA: NfeD family protein [Fimbriimonadaceae bacterium]|nr:NfeD family protein [Fimbriimonadaceae bacterium]